MILLHSQPAHVAGFSGTGARYSCPRNRHGMIEMEMHRNSESVVLDHRLAVAKHQLRAGLALTGFAIALPVTLMSSEFAMSLIGACGLFTSGLVAGYQAGMIGVAATRRSGVKQAVPGHK